MGSDNIKRFFDLYIDNFTCKDCSLEFVIKDVQKINDVEHNRYIIIDNFALNSPRGFDFMGSENKLRNDFEMSFGEIKNDVLKLMSNNSRYEYF